MTIQEDFVVFYCEKEQFWRNENGQYHRIGGPAVLYPDGSQLWCQDGYVRRFDGPAVLESDGSQYLNGNQESS